MSNDLVNRIKNDLHHVDPYLGFDWNLYKEDRTGGEIYPIFEQLVKNIKPQLIVEVGSWKGKSSIHFADLVKKEGFEDPAIICVDTWLGSDPVHQWAFLNDDTWGMKKMYKFGYPTLYYQFLANVCYAGHQDIIVPFPNTSSVAAKWLAQANLHPALIYIDGCHDEDECYLDLKHFWPLLPVGGVMFGDDWDVLWYGVICAVSRFSKENNIQLLIAEGHKWILQKTG